MSLHLRKAFIFSLLGILSFSVLCIGQGKPMDGTAVQRLEVMPDKVDRMRRSLNSSISAVKEENKSDKSKKDDEKKLETPLGRLVALEKDVSRISSEVNSLRGKVDRADRKSVV